MTDVKTADSSATKELEEFAGRVGIALLTCAHDGDAKAEYQRLVDALRADPRVKAIECAEVEETKLTRPTFPTSKRSVQPKKGEADKPPLPHHHMHALRTEHAIRLNVQVPRRLQAKDGREGQVPSDEYWAIWDGVSVLTMWRRSDSERPFGQRGGMVVLDVLKDAARKSGLTFRSQPCGPNCTYPFSHAKLKIKPAASERNISLSDQGGSIALDLPDVGDPMAVLSAAYGHMRFDFGVFAEMRAAARALSQSENFAREELTELLTLHYRKASVGALALSRSKIAGWRGLRGFQRQSRRLEALLWLRLAGIERQHRRWARLKHIFDSSASKRGVDLLFSTEYAQDVDLVNSLDISSIRAAVEQTGARVDSRIMAWVTGAGAIAGASAGTIIGRLG